MNMKQMFVINEVIVRVHIRTGKRDDNDFGQKVSQRKYMKIKFITYGLWATVQMSLSFHCQAYGLTTVLHNPLESSIAYRL